MVGNATVGRCYTALQLVTRTSHAIDVTYYVMSNYRHIARNIIRWCRKIQISQKVIHIKF